MWSSTAPIALPFGSSSIAWPDATRALVSASAVRFDGQISVFDPRQPEGPCYACLFPPIVP